MAPEAASPFHSRPCYPGLVSRTTPRCRIPRTGTSYRVDLTLVITPCFRPTEGFQDYTIKRAERTPFYFFKVIGWPQQWSVPAPPLVTIISDPHFAQTYLLPNWFANLAPPSFALGSFVSSLIIAFLNRGGQHLVIESSKTLSPTREKTFDPKLVR